MVVAAAAAVAVVAVAVVVIAVALAATLAVDSSSSVTGVVANRSSLTLDAVAVVAVVGVAEVALVEVVVLIMCGSITGSGISSCSGSNVSRYLLLQIRREGTYTTLCSR